MQPVMSHDYTIEKAPRFDLHLNWYFSSLLCWHIQNMLSVLIEDEVEYLLLFPQNAFGGEPKSNSLIEVQMPQKDDRQENRKFCVFWFELNGYNF